MKTLLSIAAVAFVFFSKISFGQITLEHVYDHARTDFSGAIGNQLMIVDFEDYGPHYVKLDGVDGQILIYDLSHNLTNTITVPNNLLTGSQYNYVLYLSQKLFDLDEGIEYLITDGAQYATYIYDEDGTQLLYAKNQFPVVRTLIPSQQHPIYNTPVGTKMILSNTIQAKDSAYVYSLPGTLSTAIGEVNYDYLSNLNANKIFPNPTSSQASIELQLSTNDLPALLKVFDLSGNEIASYKISSAKNSIAISTLELPAGVYYYDIETPQQIFSGRKFVVTH